MLRIDWKPLNSLGGLHSDVVLDRAGSEQAATVLMIPAGHHDIFPALVWSQMG